MRAAEAAGMAAEPQAAAGGVGGGWGADQMLQAALPLAMLMGGGDDDGGGEKEKKWGDYKNEADFEADHQPDDADANFKGFDTANYGTVGGANPDEFRFFSKGGLVDKKGKPKISGGEIMAMMHSPHHNVPPGMDPQSWMNLTMGNIPQNLSQPAINREMSARGAQAQEKIGGLEDQLAKLKKDKEVPQFVEMQGVQMQGVPSTAYLNKGGLASIPQSKIDNVPAMLTEGEFVMNANAVKGLGGGSTEKGAEKLYAMQGAAEAAAPNPEIPDRELVAATAEAIANPGPNAHAIIMAFVEQFGEEALEDLVARVKQTGMVA
jgi:hypothetical protein